MSDLRSRRPAALVAALAIGLLGSGAVAGPRTVDSVVLFDTHGGDWASAMTEVDRRLSDGERTVIIHGESDEKGLLLSAEDDNIVWVKQTEVVPGVWRIGLSEEAIETPDGSMLYAVDDARNADPVRVFCGDAEVCIMKTKLERDGRTVFAMGKVIASRRDVVRIAAAAHEFIDRTR